MYMNLTHNITLETIYEEKDVYLFFVSHECVFGIDAWFTLAYKTRGGVRTPSKCQCANIFASK